MHTSKVWYNARAILLPGFLNISVQCCMYGKIEIIPQRIVPDRNATQEKRTHVGRPNALRMEAVLFSVPQEVSHATQNSIIFNSGLVASGNPFLSRLPSWPSVSKAISRW